MAEKVDWKRAEEPVPLDGTAATRLLGPWLAGRRIRRVTWLSGGLMNRNYLVELDAPPARCVLRFYVRDAASAAREIAALGLVGGDVPAPRVLFASEAAEDPPFAVLSFVEGISLFALRRSGDTVAVGQACRDAGRVLARIGRHAGPATPRQTLAGLVERLSASSAFRRRVGEERAIRVARRAEEWQPRVAELDREPVLVHGDFNSANLLVGPTPAGWRVTGVLDWEFALAASPWCDVGNFLRYHRPERPRYEPDFSDGLRDGGVDLPPDWLTLARLHDLPALCELLGRTDVPEPVVAELIELIDRATAG